MQKRLLPLFILTAMLCCCPSAMKAQWELSKEKDPQILLGKKNISVNYKDTIVTIDVMTNSELVITSQAEWIKPGKKQSKNALQLAIGVNMNSARSGNVIVEDPEKKTKAVITVAQGPDNSVEFFKPDTKIKVTSGTASSYQGGGGIELSFDNNLSTIYHSNWTNTGANYFPITLDYNFTDAKQIDYLIYYPRQSGSNGHFKEVEIWSKSNGNNQYVKYGSFDFGGSSQTTKITFAEPLINPTSVRFIVKSGVGDGQGFATCAEMEFYKVNEENERNFDLFSDGLMTVLKPEVTLEQIDTISNLFIRDLALRILQNDYPTDYRVAEYNAILKPGTLGSELHIGNGYSNYEGVTGIMIPKGKHVVIVEGLAENSKMNLLVPNWERRAPEGIAPDKDPAGWGIHKKSFPLSNGLNFINQTDWDGLAYISYYSEKPENENKVKVHFVKGRVNGYFDITKHSDTDFNNLLTNAIYPCMDAVGRYSQCIYPVSAFKQYAWGKGVDLISKYDSLVHRQHRFIGLVKYNRKPTNRILARVNYNYYMFRDGDGVAYMGTNPGNAMGMVVNPASVVVGDPCWGFSHEVGHVHQLAPYLNWGGLGEVSNNFASLYVTTSFGNISRIKEGGNYASARKSIIEGKKCYLQDNDVFNRLVPFWQLHLWYKKEKGKDDFYADMYEIMRNLEDIEPAWKNVNRSTGVAQFQLNFVKKVCQLTKTDLTDFFDAYGFFWVGTITMDDYGTYTYTMTQKMVDDCKAEIATWGFSKPTIDPSTMED